jgi:hypothetical protein
VYATRVPGLPTLRGRIRDVTASFSADMLDRTCKKLSTDLILFVSPVSHMLKCTKLTTVTQILLSSSFLRHKLYSFSFYSFFHSDGWKCGRFERETRIIQTSFGF